MVRLVDRSPLMTMFPEDAAKEGGPRSASVRVVLSDRVTISRNSLFVSSAGPMLSCGSQYTSTPALIAENSAA